MRSRSALFACTAAVLLTAVWLYAGPLNPPSGPITGTYKTLTEVEPRIAINATNTPGDATCLFRITQPGSYYLPGNVLGVAGKHGIKITLGGSGGHVRIDMKGHTLKGVPGTLNGFSYTDIDPDAATELEFYSDSGTGVVTGWGGLGIHSRGSGKITNLSVFSTADGCATLTGGASTTVTIENCRLYTTGGPALVTDSPVLCRIRDTIVEADGCDTTSLIALGGETTFESVAVRARTSTFSQPVVAVSTRPVWTGRECWIFMTSCTAPSSFRIGSGSDAAVLSEWEFNYSGCVFSTAMLESTRDGMLFRNVRVRADATTSAPVGLRIAANGSTVDGGLWNLLSAAVPIVADVLGSNNTISGSAMSTAGTGIRLTGSSNTATGCRINGTGAGSFVGILIPTGSNTNLVTKNEFVNVGGGAATSNLGGSSNGVAPLVTPGTLNAATNPFSNIQH